MRKKDYYFQAYVFLWIFVFLLVFLYFLNSFSVTGYIPLTGVLDNSNNEQISFSDFNMTLSMDEGHFRRIWDAGFFIDFSGEPLLNNRVELDYLVLDPSGELIYSDSEEVQIQDGLRLDRRFDMRKFRRIDLEDGNYSFILVANYLDKQKKFQGEFELLSKGSGYSVKQLFDISLKLDKNYFNDLNDLLATVTFESFGSEPTPINLTFIIYDKNGGEVYRVNRGTVVETEQVLVEDFSGIDIKPGFYELILISDYNEEVIDGYKQYFMYEKKVSWVPFLLAGIFFIFGGIILFKRILFGGKSVSKKRKRSKRKK